MIARRLVNCRSLLAPLLAPASLPTCARAAACTGIRLQLRSFNQFVGGGDLAHVCGDETEPLLTMTVDELLKKAVQEHHSAPALICPEEQGPGRARMTYTELDDAVEAAAKGLVALGVKPGDRLGCWLPNVPEYVVLQFATARMGAVLTTINPAYRLPELLHALSITQTTVLAIVPGIASSNYLQMVQELLVHADRPEALRHVLVIPGMGPAGEGAPPVDANEAAFAIGDKVALPYHCLAAIGQGGGDPTNYASDISDTINIQFTSGTTGMPKATALSHRNIVNNAHFVAQAQNLTSADRICVPVPMYHCFGVVMGSLAAVSTGAACVFPSRTFSPEKTLAAVESVGCTSLYGVPTMFIAQLAHPRFSEFDLGTLRTGIMAGSVCPRDTMKQVQAEMHMADVTICYGMTETSPVSWQSPAGKTPFDKLISTVGTIHPHAECKVVDEQGNTVPTGTTGELLTKGYLVMEGGYYNDAAATADAVKDGWMHTGDIASIDSEGYCTIVGRAKDTIIRGGENIAPSEVEAVLRRLSVIRDVSVVGVIDLVYGEQICACVILNEPAGSGAPEEEPKEAEANLNSKVTESIKALCREQLAHFKEPKYVRFVTSFPMTVSGKVREPTQRQLASLAVYASRKAYSNGEDVRSLGAEAHPTVPVQRGAGARPARRPHRR
jgi:fatty-acyl-CoA synthase